VDVLWRRVVSEAQDSADDVAEAAAAAASLDAQQLHKGLGQLGMLPPVCAACGMRDAMSIRDIVMSCVYHIGLYLI
jgi:hypothetical protein